MQAQITLSYNQLCVFDPSLERPYNDWNAAQTDQGFSWRPGSVSFRTDERGPSATIIAQRADVPPDIDGASAAIRVPFTVPASGVIEIGSILSGVPFSIPPGPYALYFVHPSEPEGPFILSFVACGKVEPAVLKESATARAQPSYDMKASAA